MLQFNQMRHQVSELQNTIYKVNKKSLSKRRLKNRTFRNKQRYFLQDPLDGTNKLPSTAIMGLILITLPLAFLLMLGALRSQISVHRNHAGTTKQNKEKKENQDKNKSYQKHYNMTNRLSSWDKPTGRRKQNSKRMKHQSRKNEEIRLSTIRRQESSKELENQDS